MSIILFIPKPYSFSGYSKAILELLGKKLNRALISFAGKKLTKKTQSVARFFFEEILTNRNTLEITKTIHRVTQVRLLVEKCPQ